MIFFYLILVFSVADIIWEDGAIASNLRSKCEALAVSGLVEYGDVIAPADVLKQIFKIPYSKARLSIAVHRVGQTLVLNSGFVSFYSCFVFHSVKSLM